MQKVKIFCTAFVQVFFVCINIKFISSNNLAKTFLSSFLINLLWTINIRKMAFSNNIERLIYSLGAASGSLSGLIILKHLNV